MTDDEARTVAEIANEAAGDCPVCSWWLAKDLAAAFPEHAQVFRSVYEARYGVPATWE